MPSRIREALARMDERRKVWYLCRRDSDPDGVWYAKLDPKPEWDWCYKVGRCKWLCEARVTRAYAESRTGRKLMEMRRLVDTIRHSGGAARSRPTERP